MRLTLKGVTSGAESVTTTAAAIDKDGVAKKVKALVDAYNAVVTSVRAELTEKSDPKATTTAGPAEGQAVRRHRADLDAVPAQGPDDAGRHRPRPDGLADLGIDIPKTTGAASSEDAKAGKLTSTPRS